MAMTREFHQTSFLSLVGDDGEEEEEEEEEEGKAGEGGGGGGPLASGRHFDVVLFNGSLQFFSDLASVLRRAAALLPSSPSSSSTSSAAPSSQRRAGGRVVIAHANGAAFVEQEHRGSPLVAVSTMPSMDELAALLEQAATTSEGGGSSMMTVVQPTQLAERDGGSPIDLDEFYLCACDLEL